MNISNYLDVDDVGARELGVLGRIEGFLGGITLGPRLGAPDGIGVSSIDGSRVGPRVGLLVVGSKVGSVVGTLVGAAHSSHGSTA